MEEGKAMTDATEKTKAIEELREHVRNMLKLSTPDERIDFIDTVMADFCQYCGSDQVPCNCHLDA